VKNNKNKINIFKSYRFSSLWNILVLDEHIYIDSFQDYNIDILFN